MSTLFNATPPFFTIYIGDNVQQLFQIIFNDLPVDLTGAAAISITLKNDPGQVSPTVVASVANGKIAVVSAVLGTLNLILLPSDTAGLEEAAQIDIEVVVTNAAGKIQTYKVPNGLTVEKRHP